MLYVDGSRGEGGGQILRSALSVSLCTGKPVHVARIREKRRVAGLGVQHLTAARLATQIGHAATDGVELRSTELKFRPRGVFPGDYDVDLGTAGSTTLVLQSVLPALLTAAGDTAIRLRGGTHNPMAPPYEFLQRAFLPLIARMGPVVRTRLVRPGFYPAGGGILEAYVDPAPELAPLSLMDRGDVVEIRATALLSQLPAHVGRRELRVVRRDLGVAEGDCHLDVVDGAGPGNALLIEVECSELTEVFVAFGERGLPAEAVAGRVVREVHQYLDAGVPVGPHLADQLLLPMALAGGGEFRTMRPTPHTATQAELLTGMGLPRVDFERLKDGSWKCTVGDGPGG